MDINAKRLTKQDIDSGNKGYRYITAHGIGPGTLPKDVALLDWEDLPNYKTAIYLDRPLTTQELDYYGIYPEHIQEGKKVSVFESLTEDDVDAISQLNLNETELNSVLSLFELIVDDDDAKTKAMELISSLFKDKKLVPVDECITPSKSMSYTRKLLGDA